MEPTDALITSLDREEVDDSRKLTIRQRLELSGDLFDMACEVTLSGIRMQNPGIGGAEALDVLRKRLDLGRRLESRL